MLMDHYLKSANFAIVPTINIPSFTLDSSSTSSFCDKQPESQPSSSTSPPLDLSSITNFASDSSMDSKESKFVPSFPQNVLIPIRETAKTTNYWLLFNLT
ncbi:hypothetical protein S245_024213 [Arachis hypogaea]